jgi:hypothetical protein
MSLEKNRQEAERWLKTAEGDLETAVILYENITGTLTRMSKQVDEENW